MVAIKVLVADDEPIMADELSDLVAEAGGQVVGVAHSGHEALSLAKKTQPDLLFLDIKMPDMDGLAVARRLAALPHPPTVVFATAYDEYALQAFSVNALDYVLKPFDEGDINRVLDKYRKIFATLPASFPKGVSPSMPSWSHKFSVESNDRGEIIDSSQIAVIYAKDRQVFIRTIPGKTYRTKLTLQEFEHCLDPHKFFRCHRNYIVNVDVIKQIIPWFNRGYMLVLSGSRDRGGETLQIPVSRFYVRNLKEHILFS